MHMPGFYTLLLLIGVGVLLFGGGGKISSIMEDVAKGIKSFKKGMADDDSKPIAPAEAPKVIDRSEKV